MLEFDDRINELLAEEIRLVRNTAADIIIHPANRGGLRTVRQNRRVVIVRSADRQSG